MREEYRQGQKREKETETTEAKYVYKRCMVPHLCKYVNILQSQNSLQP